jgi:hypothetical protein
MLLQVCTGVSGSGALSESEHPYWKAESVQTHARAGRLDVSAKTTSRDARVLFIFSLTSMIAETRLGSLEKFRSASAGQGGQLTRAV